MRNPLLALVLGSAVTLGLGGCPNRKAEAPVATPDAAYDPNPYKNVMPSKVKADVEKIQDQEEERNEARRKQAVEGQ